MVGPTPANAVACRTMGTHLRRSNLVGDSPADARDADAKNRRERTCGAHWHAYAGGRVSARPERRFLTVPAALCKASSSGTPSVLQSGGRLGLCATEFLPELGANVAGGQPHHRRNRD